jgi:hypothetical protein
LHLPFLGGRNLHDATALEGRGLEIDSSRVAADEVSSGKIRDLADMREGLAHAG